MYDFLYAGNVAVMYCIGVLELVKRQPLFPTQLDCAHSVSTTSVSTPSRLRTRLLLHISIVIRLVNTHPDCPHFVCAHSVIHIFVATLCFFYTKRLCAMPLLHIAIQYNQSTTSLSCTARLCT